MCADTSVIIPYGHEAISGVAGHEQRDHDKGQYTASAAGAADLGDSACLSKSLA